MRQPDLSFIAVTYRSAARAALALHSLRSEVEKEGLGAEIILVDHSESEFEAGALTALNPDRLVVQPNRGYAAGLNAGIELACGETLLLANPDIEFLPGSLAPLLGALDAGAAIAGPQFILGSFLFPPAEVQRPREEFRRLWRQRSAGALRRSVSRSAAHWAATWRANEPLEVEALSGALLALRGTTARRLGPWDEGYFLYFEEMEWQRRARRQGLPLWLVPRARIRHTWGHAADPAANSEHFLRSRRRFYLSSFPMWGRLVLGLPASKASWAWPSLPEALPRLRRGVWLVSPSPAGLPAAGALDLTTEEVRHELTSFAHQRSHGGALTVAAWEPATGTLHGPWCWQGA